MWPHPTELVDFIRASTPVELHRVSLGLEFHSPETPWIMEGLSTDICPQAAWGHWCPGRTPPGWWRVLDAQGHLLRYVRRTWITHPSAVSLEHIQNLAHLHAQPILFAPEGVMGPGIIVGEAKEILERPQGPASDSDRLGGTGFHLLCLDPADPGQIQNLFGGYFMPGAILLDWIMGLALSKAPPVPGFPRIPSPNPVRTHSADGITRREPRRC